MSLDEKLLETLKSHTLALKQAMPDLPQDEFEKLITKSITDSKDIQENQKEEIIKILLELGR